MGSPSCNPAGRKMVHSRVLVCSQLSARLLRRTSCPKAAQSPFGQVLPAVATAEGGDQQQAAEPGALHLVDRMAVALIIHRCTLAKAAEGGDYPGIPCPPSGKPGSRPGVQGISDDDLDSQGMQLAGHVGMAHQGNDPVGPVAVRGR